MLKLNQEQIEDCEKYAGVGCTLDQIAALLGISPRTLDNIIARDESVKESIDRGRAKANHKVMNTAYNMAVSGKIPAMTIFWLKARLRWNEARDQNPAEGEQTSNEFTLNYKKSE